MLADGTVFWGRGFGVAGAAVGEVCFNTAMTGYQEILTDPSYAAQIITFTFPHIGNVGANLEDVETATPAARGLVIRSPITAPANWRATKPLDRWVEEIRPAVPAAELHIFSGPRTYGAVGAAKAGAMRPILAAA